MLQASCCSFVLLPIWHALHLVDHKSCHAAKTRCDNWCPFYDCMTWCVRCFPDCQRRSVHSNPFVVAVASFQLQPA